MPLDIVSMFYSNSIIVGIIVGVISLYAISREKWDVNMIILSDVVELAMLIIVASVGSDLAEALILPGLVVGMAELLAVSEIYISRKNISDEKIRCKSKSRKVKLLEEFTIKESPNLNVNFTKMQILETSPKFLAVILIIYGAILSGFTGGAVMASGLIYYLLSKRVLGEQITKADFLNIWDGFISFSGIAWTLWVLGFLGFFIMPSKWPVFLLVASLGLVLKVGSKLGLIGHIWKP
ncbi:EhaG family protein [Methanococcus voltae]|uniref:Energy-converting hydrogenase A subunit G n=2 Tax=Methanococcus voltae TaxID=2188 RepID=A0A8J7RH40_METVO|nr:EhaG family protein [Methanococcus voltae]MBP2172863.1 energy-converting hydrogenase A subunit G [Methanococcus voltae]MBP2201727.1 energy-converting hydrogenase A subunit G [Methanococcus voltae]MCS3922515.1 energy-converting hydrogenase A subunit G [Methanococcus voltae PS]